MKIAGILVSVLLFVLPVDGFGQSLRAQIIGNHFGYVPAGEGRWPTLIAIPGCSGISTSYPDAENAGGQLQADDLLFRRHYRIAAEGMMAEGFVVLLVNIHAAEGLITACAGQIESERIAAYINDAVAYASDLPYVDPRNINIIGWSMGGGGVLQWLDGPRSETANVRSAIAVYPDCDEQGELNVPVPLLMLLGGSDDIAEPSKCERLVAAAASKQQIFVTNYPGARHGFDIADAPPVLEIANGMTIGYQEVAAEASWIAILRFLSSPAE